MPPTSSVTSTVRIAKGFRSRIGDTPAALITMSSLSPMSLFSVYSTAMNRAMGAITITRAGRPSAVTPRNTSSVCPLVVSRSNSFSACVIQITAVRTPSATRKDDRTMRKM